ncbi:CvpA family protein [Hyalangium minutum]|uniref:CvpA family protein n=1 Tax=Hyalangium minutum TaxID=394096 RepID=A0A085WAT1_9BACT|nr:CvpA family protein [Hyalangium minutum]KFE64794.1 CvpA family protein [Hyalangium minutum]
MVIDVTILCLVIFFALIGAISGAAKQIAQMVGMAVAYFASKRLGPVLGPKLAGSFGDSQLAGVLVASVLVFVVVLITVRYALVALLQRLMAGKDPNNRGPDRMIGFVLGGTKVALICYVVMSALTFVEQHVVVAGKKLGISPKDSKAFGLVRSHNLFEMTQFAPIKDFVRVAQASTDPERARKLQNDPAYKALRQDPRFQRALKEDSLRRALEQGDTQALLRSNLILQLIQDPEFAARLGAAAQASDR